MLAAAVSLVTIPSHERRRTGRGAGAAEAGVRHARPQPAGRGLPRRRAQGRRRRGREGARGRRGRRHAVPLQPHRALLRLRSRSPRRRARAATNAAPIRTSRTRSTARRRYRLGVESGADAEARAREMVGLLSRPAQREGRAPSAPRSARTMHRWPQMILAARRALAALLATPWRRRSGRQNRDRRRLEKAGAGVNAAGGDAESGELARYPAPTAMAGTPRLSVKDGALGGLRRNNLASRARSETRSPSKGAGANDHVRLHRRSLRADGEPGGTPTVYKRVGK